MDGSNWNTKVLWKMRSEIEYQWDLIEEATENLFAELERAVSEHLKKLEEYIQNVQASPDHALLVDLVKYNHDMLQYALAQEFRRTRTELRIIHLKSCKATRFSYIVDEMTSAYREASCQYGAGKHDRQVAIIQNHLKTGDVFLNLGNRLSKDAHQAVENVCTSLERLVEDMFGKVERGF
ncbi:hypothetical protein Sste5346_004838 [Sporothrix stenoceras]|uniref:DUF7605 domain-containing protein n=1 Tax=Sporothrix stenoceras TaxID=5173 RepID=A0ABR3Z8E8_9PEZI